MLTKFQTPALSVAFKTNKIVSRELSPHLERDFSLLIHVFSGVFERGPEAYKRFQDAIRRFVDSEKEISDLDDMMGK